MCTNMRPAIGVLTVAAILAHGGSSAQASDDPEALIRGIRELGSNVVSVRISAYVVSAEGLYLDKAYLSLSPGDF